MIAPRAIRIHRELIISILEYIADTEGRCKEAERTDNDRLDRAAKRRRNRFPLVRSVVAKLLVLCCHENRIIDRRAELNQYR